jgi:uncharacterized membrane protein
VLHLGQAQRLAAIAASGGPRSTAAAGTASCRPTGGPLVHPGTAEGYPRRSDRGEASVDVLHIVLRVIHIGAGIIWVGSSLFLHFFIEPTVHALGPQGGPFMRHLMEKRKMPVVISISGVLTVVAGVWLYWRDTSGFDPDLVTSSIGLGFLVGGIAAILAFVLGVGVVRPLAVRMGTLGETMASGQPTQQQVQEMGAIQGKLRRISTINLVLLAIAVIAMASARYL